MPAGYRRRHLKREPALPGRTMMTLTMPNWARFTLRIGILLLIGYVALRARGWWRLFVVGTGPLAVWLAAFLLRGRRA